MFRKDIEALLLPLVADLGYELWGCEYLAQGKHSLLRIYIDKIDGISIHDCEIVSRHVGALLDIEDPIPGNYSLEVSSPGIPRPLFIKEHYQRYLGQEVQLKLYQPIDGRRKLKGIIAAVHQDTIALQINDETLEVPLAHIVKANLIGE